MQNSTSSAVPRDSSADGLFGVYIFDFGVFVYLMNRLVTLYFSSWSFPTALLNSGCIASQLTNYMAFLGASVCFMRAQSLRTSF